MLQIVINIFAVIGILFCFFVLAGWLIAEVEFKSDEHANTDETRG